jgi:hemerythrin-like domain-containing protein
MSDLTIHHLLREHREIEQSLARLETLLDEKDLSPQWTQQFSEDFQWLLKGLGDRVERHIRKEEQVLFPALEAYLPRDTGPLAVLRGEHSDAREMMRLLHHAVEVQCGGRPQPEALQAVETYGRGLLQVARDHYYKEDRVLFPMVSRFLSPERDAELLRQLEALDQEKISSDPNPSPPRLMSRGRRTPMVIDKQDLIERLKLEVQVIEMGGYSPSVRQPRQALHIFRDSVSCPNLGLQEKVEPCAHCFLMEFVPPEHQDKDNACHFIPLNEKGETVASLEAQDGGSEKAQAAVLAWLKMKIAELGG